jgi:putative ABC transport system ATP-binding protein
MATGGIPVMVADNVRKSYRIGRRTLEVLHGVNLAVMRGEFVAIMGPSGCGKSTLLYVLGLMTPPDSGFVRIDGVNASGEPAKICREKIGFVFQRFNLIPVLSAEDNVALSLRIRGKPIDGKKIAATLGDMGLNGKALHRPGELSIGEQQRVAIARAVVHRPSILLADEPTGNLDSETARSVLELFRRLNEAGQSLLMVTHSEEAASYAQRIIHMRDGLLSGQTVRQPDSGE